MSNATQGRLPDELIARAKAVRVFDEISRRGHKLRRDGRQMVGACPACGGVDRFWIDLRRNLWGCRHCGKRYSDVIALTQHLDGIEFRDAVLLLTGEGPAPRRAPVARPAAAPVPYSPASDTHDYAMRLWCRAVPIWSTVAERYFSETRKLALPADVSPRVLRFDPHCCVEREWWPALITLYRDILTDAPRAIQRTPLKADGTPAMVGGKKRLALGPVGGAAIKLSDDADVTKALTVGEGAETVLAAMLVGFAPAWALGSAGAIAKFPVIPEIETLTILVDNDASGAGQTAAHECAARWTAAGRDVVMIVPNSVGADISDLITGKTAT